MCSLHLTLAQTARQRGRKQAALEQKQQAEKAQRELEEKEREEEVHLEQAQQHLVAADGFNSC
jgi:hypothetical protein